MIPLNLIEDYLVDNEDGMRNLITSFLNLVMQFEARHQAQTDPYERTVTRRAYRNGYKERSLKMPFNKGITKGAPQRGARVQPKVAHWVDEAAICPMLKGLIRS